MKIIISALYIIIEILEKILGRLKVMTGDIDILRPQSPRTDEMLMSRLQVQKYLDISETTYKRKVKEGKLKPMRLPGGHKYHKSDLLAEYNESVRRGRI